jgi:hypothetical protein
LSDSLFEFFKIADSILELCFESRSRDLLALDAGETILLKFMSHGLSPLLGCLVHEKKCGVSRTFFER